MTARRPERAWSPGEDLRVRVAKLRESVREGETPGFQMAGESGSELESVSRKRSPSGPEAGCGVRPAPVAMRDRPLRQGEGHDCESTRYRLPCSRNRSVS